MFQYFNIDDTLKADPHFCEHAAKHGALDILKYLHSQGFAWNEDVYLHCVEYLHTNIRFPKSFNLCGAQKDCFKYMKECGLELDTQPFPIYHTRWTIISYGYSV